MAISFSLVVILPSKHVLVEFPVEKVLAVPVMSSARMKMSVVIILTRIWLFLHSQFPVIFALQVQFASYPQEKVLENVAAHWWICPLANAWHLNIDLQ